MIKKSILIVMIPFILVSCVDQITVLNSTIPENIVSYMVVISVKINSDGTHLFFQKNTETITGLLKILKFLEKNELIIQENISNVDSTNPFYIKQNVLLQKNGNFTIIKDEEDNYRLIYDVNHIDSIKNGDQKGYVKYPKINIGKEMSELIKTKNEIAFLKQLLAELDSHSLVDIN